MPLPVDGGEKCGEATQPYCDLNILWLGYWQPTYLPSFGYHNFIYFLGPLSYMAANRSSASRIFSLSIPGMEIQGKRCLTSRTKKGGAALPLPSFSQVIRNPCATYLTIKPPVLIHVKFLPAVAVAAELVTASQAAVCGPYPGGISCPEATVCPDHPDGA